VRPTPSHNSARRFSALSLGGICQQLGAESARVDLWRPETRISGVKSDRLADPLELLVQYYDRLADPLELLVQYY
jgi:hypothetical protein